MQEASGDIVNLVIIGTIFFLLLGGSIVLLINLFSRTRRNHFLEKENMQQLFQQELLQAQLEIQENTFNNISKEIHDNVGQVLSLAKVQLNIIDTTKDYDDGLVRDIKESVSKAMADLRDIAKSLSGEKMQQTGLLQSIEDEIARINRIKLLDAALIIKGEPCLIDERKQLIVFRMVQEALQNVFKHSHASRLEIILDYLQSTLLLTIKDNGIGFDTNKIKVGSLGLKNICTRIAIIKGEALIYSEESEGTNIKLKIPYE